MVPYPKNKKMNIMQLVLNVVSYNLRTLWYIFGGVDQYVSLCKTLKLQHNTAQAV